MSGILGDLAILGGALVALVLAVLGYGQAQKRKGRDDAEGNLKDADQKRADGVRDRVRDLPDRLREYEGRGYRDGDGDL